MSPEVTAFSAGYRNRFRHPRPEVVARYRQVDSRILRSDRQGALEFEIDDANVRITAERERRRRYWQDPPVLEAPEIPPR